MVQDHGFARVGTMQVQAIMPPSIDHLVLFGPIDFLSGKKNNININF